VATDNFNILPLFLSVCVFRPPYQLENRRTVFDGTLIEPVDVTPLLVTYTSGGVNLLQMVITMQQWPEILRRN
jgi:hypothetical protein